MSITVAAYRIYFQNAEKSSVSSNPTARLIAWNFRDGFSTVPVLVAPVYPARLWVISYSQRPQIQ